MLPRRVRAYPDLRISLEMSDREEHHDIIILHSDLEVDKNVAESLKDAIEALRIPYRPDPDNDRTVEVQPKVVVRDDACTHVNNYIDWLQEALNYNTLIFVLFTPDLLEDNIYHWMTGASFWETVTENDRVYSFVPVFLDETSNKTMKISPFYRVIKPLILSRIDHMKIVAKLLDHHLPKRLKRETEQLAHARPTYHHPAIDQQAQNKGVADGDPLSLMPGGRYSDSNRTAQFVPSNVSSSPFIDGYDNSAPNNTVTTEERNGIRHQGWPTIVPGSWSIRILCGGLVLAAIMTVNRYYKT